MEATAISRYTRVTARKARLVSDAVRGMKVSDAEDRLRYVPNAATKAVLRVIRSAAANAKKQGAAQTVLHIRKIQVNDGPFTKSFHPKSMGRIFPVRKRTCHIQVTVGSEA